MPNYHVAWKAPESRMPTGSPEEDHYEVRFGSRAEQAPKGALSCDFRDITAPGEHPVFVQDMDANNQPIGPVSVGPVVTIQDNMTVTVHLPEDVTADIIVEEIP